MNKAALYWKPHACGWVTVTALKRITTRHSNAGCLCNAGKRPSASPPLSKNLALMTFNQRSATPMDGGGSRETGCLSINERPDEEIYCRDHPPTRERKSFNHPPICFSSGRSSRTSMASTAPAITRAPPTCSSRGSRSTTTRPLAESMFLAQFWWIWSQAPWTL